MFARDINVYQGVLKYLKGEGGIIQLTQDSCNDACDQFRDVELAFQLDALQFIFQKDDIAFIVVVGSRWQRHELVVLRNLFQNAGLKNLVLIESSNDDAGLGGIFVQIRYLLECKFLI